MRWMGQRESANVEDRRGVRGGGLALGGLGTLVVVLLAAFFGVDPSVILNQAPPSAQHQQSDGPYKGTAEEEQLKKFVSVVLADTEDTWQELFQRNYNRNYARPKLVLFTGSVDSACGSASTAVGPFYCPNDESVYVDLSFYQQLRDQLGAPGDFAEAYVVAHEVGHHVQHLQGTFGRVHQGQKGADSDQVRIELQADFYAGVWAHYAQQRGLLEQGDVEEALNAAAAIGDDKLQKKGQGYVVPDSFTHGTSAQRVRWFRKGLETGDIRQGDTFKTSNL